MRYWFYMTGIILLVGLPVLGLTAGAIKTYQVQHHPNQAKFRNGKLPEPLPDGSYKGSQFTGLGKNWQGKVFDRSAKTGINQFKDGQRYGFRTYPAPGLRDKDRQVLRIDYGQSGNPLWLRPVVDEIVQVSPGHYLGKIQVKVLPGVVFSIGYFELRKPAGI